VDGSVVRGRIGRLWGLEITFRRPTMDCVAHPAGARPWNSRGAHRQAGRRQLHLRPVAFYQAVEDLHEALVGAVPGIRFGLAFCEASGKRLVRWSGNDEAALALARDNALAIGAGHTS
jgi:adenosine specific kinase